MPSFHRNTNDPSKLEQCASDPCKLHPYNQDIHADNLEQAYEIKYAQDNQDYRAVEKLTFSGTSGNAEIDNIVNRALKGSRVSQDVRDTYASVQGLEDAPIRTVKLTADNKAILTSIASQYKASAVARTALEEQGFKATALAQSYAQLDELKAQEKALSNRIKENSGNVSDTNMKNVIYKTGDMTFAINSYPVFDDKRLVEDMRGVYGVSDEDMSSLITETGGNWSAPLLKKAGADNSVINAGYNYSMDMEQAWAITEQTTGKKRFDKDTYTSDTYRNLTDSQLKMMYLATAQARTQAEQEIKEREARFGVVAGDNARVSDNSSFVGDGGEINTVSYKKGRLSYKIDKDKAREFAEKHGIPEADLKTAPRRGFNKERALTVLNSLNTMRELRGQERIPIYMYMKPRQNTFFRTTKGGEYNGSQTEMAIGRVLAE